MGLIIWWLLGGSVPLETRAVKVVLAGLGSLEGRLPGPLDCQAQRLQALIGHPLVLDLVVLLLAIDVGYGNKAFCFRFTDEILN